MELLLPFILLIGVMLLMTRSAKNKQRQAMDMRDSIQPGTGVRTIGGMYAVADEVREDTVVLETAAGMRAVFAKNAIAAVLDPEEYERIVTGQSGLDEETPVVPDDASSLTGETASEREKEDSRPDSTKDEADETTSSDEDGKSQGSSGDGENGSRS